jgi:glycosyltransferase involved in cell wall biosynthesis
MTAFRTPLVGRLLAYFHRRYSRAIIPCQNLIADEIAKLGYASSKTDVVYNGVDIAKISAAVTNSTVQDPVFENTTKRVGMVAGMDPRKGHLLLVQAAKHVIEKHPDASFFLIGGKTGNDEYLQQIENKINELELSSHVFLTGKVDNVYDYINMLDVYCIPSKIEALSVAGLEAMALGKPIVATDVGGNHIAVITDETGTLTSPGDAEEMGDAIVAMLDNQDLRHQYGKNGRNLVEKQFTLQQSGNQLFRNFKKYLTEHKQI